MMLRSSDCPSNDRLAALMQDASAVAADSDVARHVLECETCAEATLNLAKDETLVEAMRNMGRRSKSSPEGSPDLLADANALHADGSTSATERILRLMDKLRELPEQDAAARGEATNIGDPVAERCVAEIDWSSCFTPATQADEIGRLNGFRILKLLGYGGMGGVFLAEDLHLGRQVALKVIRPEFASRPGATERFLREAKAVAALRDEHIVTVYQVGQDRGVPFLAQELLNGETLEDRLKHEGRLSLDQCVQIVRQMAEGLAAAHERGLIHRDIKPANVFLVPNRKASTEAIDAAAANPATTLTVKLLDFGLARPLDDSENLTQSGMILGTPAYMAPEQARGENVDPRADLFSLGCVFYRMLTGQSAFAGKDVLATLSALATHSPPSPKQLDSSVPSDISELVMKLLAKQPNDRLASARDVAQQLMDAQRRGDSGIGSVDLPTFRGRSEKSVSWNARSLRDDEKSASVHC